MSSFQRPPDIPDVAGELSSRTGWWQVPHTTEEADHRGVSMLRRLLLLVAGYQLMLLLWISWPSATQPDRLMFALTLGGVLACVIAWLLLQRRQLQLAAAVFVLLNLMLISVAYGSWGLRAQLQGQVLQLLPLLLAGTMLGRRALWLSVVWLCVLLAVGARLDAASGFYNPVRVSMALQDLLFVAAGVLLTAFVLDQSMCSLRITLRTLQRRGADLARMRDALQLEMEENERSREQLVHAVRVENVERLAGGVAHDFNHLLTLITGYAGKGRRTDDPAELKVALQGVESAARRAAAVVRRLLDVSRQEVARPQLLDAASTIAGMEPMLRQLFDAQVAFELDTGQVQCQIHLDPAQLELALLSVAANAQQAMPNGGRFQLSLTHMEAQKELWIRISDSGHGMSEEVRAKCLEPFFTTKPYGQGTGLGLALTASLVAAAGGRIGVDSSPGQGTQFCLQLPARPLPDPIC
ncbi:MAG: sensor histidine kinase [Stenotrophomonas sp.]